MTRQLRNANFCALYATTRAIIDIVSRRARGVTGCQRTEKIEVGGQDRAACYGQ